MNFRMVLGAMALACITVHAGTSTPAQSPDPYSRARWTQPQKPFRIYGNTYFVGSYGLSAILVTSPDGHVLIDGTLPENVAMIEANIRALGFRVQDIKLILNSHTHSDHAGGIAALAHDSGAQVAASAKSAKALALGGNDPDDPQYGMASPYPKVTGVRIVADGETVHVGSLALQMHAMPGHTTGSSGWTWQSCEGKRCLSIAYADSISLFSNDTYRYTDPAHPERLADYRRTLTTLSALPCDILLTPHPRPDFFEKAARIETDKANPLIDAQACKVYAMEGEKMLKERLHMEASPSAGKQ